MRFKKYITLGAALLSITSMLVGCSSKDVKVNKEIQGVLESKIEESVGECKVEFGDSEVCGYEFKNNDRYQEVLFINITLKDKNLDSLSKDELGKYGRELLFKGLHKQIHVLYDKYMSSKDSYLYVNLETSKGQFITCDSLENTLDSYVKSEDCPICYLCNNEETQEDITQEKEETQEEKVNSNFYISNVDGCYHCKKCDTIPSKAEYKENTCDTCNGNTSNEEIGQCYDCGEFKPISEMTFNGRSYHCGCLENMPTVEEGYNMLVNYVKTNFGDAMECQCEITAQGPDTVTAEVLFPDGGYWGYVEINLRTQEITEYPAN